MRRAIAEARRARDIVRVNRHRGWDRLTGVVLDQGAKWVLMALDQDAGFNGYVAIRLDDVRRVAVPASAGFLRSAYLAERTWPPPSQYPNECQIGRAIHLS